MKIRYNHGIVVLFLCLLYIVVSPVNEALPVSFNRIITVLLIASEIMLAVFLRRKAKLSWLLFLVFWGVMGLYSCERGPVLSESISDTIYMFHTILLLELMQDRNVMDEILAYVRKRRRVVLTFLVLALALIGISANGSDAYEENGAFQGFMYNSHAMASTAILIMSAAELCVDARGGRLKNIFCTETLILILGVIIVVATKGRTFLIPAAVLLWRYLQMLPMKKLMKNIVAVVAFAGVVVLLWDSIAEKFIEAINNPWAKDTLAAITNFRSELWKCDFTYFREQGILGMLFGNGFSFVRELHEVRLTTRLWSHNDITYLLVASGLVGLTVYVAMYVRLARNICKKLMDWVYFGAMVIFPMLMNGFYIYNPLVWAFLLVRASLHARDRRENAGNNRK